MSDAADQFVMEEIENAKKAAEQEAPCTPAAHHALFRFAAVGSNTNKLILNRLDEIGKAVQSNGTSPRKFMRIKSKRGEVVFDGFGGVEIALIIIAAAILWNTYQSQKIRQEWQSRKATSTQTVEVRK